MLVLSRKAGEKICIGDGISVVVNRISGGHVTLAIEAPADVRILRGELVPFKAEMEKSETDAAPTNGATLSNASTVTGRPATPGPRSMTTLPPASRATMLPPGPLRQALNNSQALNTSPTRTNPAAISSVPSTH